MIKIKHMKSRIKQNSQPICGLCAFVNGFYKDNDNIKTWNKVVDKLWEYSITDLLKNPSCLNADNIKYSVIGEFFSSKNLTDFLTDNKDKIIDQLKQVNPKVINYEATEIENIDNIQKDENIFYIIPINSSSLFGKNKNNMHWLCLKYIDNQFYILNSASRKSGERKAKKHNKKGLKKIIPTICSISNLEELKSVWNDMYSRKKCVQFDFKKWLKSTKINWKSLPKNGCKNICRIKNSNNCKFCFVQVILK